MIEPAEASGVSGGDGGAPPDMNAIVRELEPVIAPVAAKRDMLRRNAQAIETLVLGSSHGDYGFDPAGMEGSFNLCSTSQDFRHSLAIYRRVQDRLPKLRNVVIFYSTFSPGHVLELSPPVARRNALAISEVFDLPLRYAEPELARYAGALRGQLATFCPEYTGWMGFLPGDRWFPPESSAAERAVPHMKLNRSLAGLTHLMALLQLTVLHGRRPLVVMPPGRSDYRAACEAIDPSPFRGLDLLREDFVDLVSFEQLSFWGDPAFRDELFGDCDHLNPEGVGPRLLAAGVGDRLGVPHRTA